MRTRSFKAIAVPVAIAAIAALSSGCELIVDFNRALIEGGVDAAFSDVSVVEASADAGVDAIVLPDAVSDVVYLDSTLDAGTDAADAVAVDSTVDAAPDATLDASPDASTDGARDAISDAASDTAGDAADAVVSDASDAG